MLDSVTLKMEATSSSQILVQIYQTIWHHIPEYTLNIPAMRTSNVKKQPMDTVAVQYILPSTYYLHIHLVTAQHDWTQYNSTTKQSAQFHQTECLSTIFFPFVTLKSAFSNSVPGFLQNTNSFQASKKAFSSFKFYNSFRGDQDVRWCFI